MLDSCHSHSLSTKEKFSVICAHLFPYNGDDGRSLTYRLDYLEMPLLMRLSF